MFAPQLTAQELPHRAPLQQHVVQVAAVHVLEHHEERAAANLPKVAEALDNVGVVGFLEQPHLRRGARVRGEG